MLLETAWEAIERAGIAPTSLHGSSTGVFVGLCCQDYGTRLAQADGAFDGHIAIGSAAAVRAPVAGEVTFAGLVPTNGLTVTIAFGDTRVSLTHLGVLRVRRGATVSEGGIDADAGPTGQAEHPVPYVHLGVRVGSGETYVDPLTLLPPRGAPFPPTAPETPPAPQSDPDPDRPSFERLFPARALETGCFFVYCNVAGTQEDIVFWGGSQVWGPRGDEKVKAPYVDPSVVSVDLSMEEVEAARPLRPTVRDTRREMVDALQESLKSLQK